MQRTKSESRINVLRRRCTLADRMFFIYFSFIVSSSEFRSRSFEETLLATEISRRTGFVGAFARRSWRKSFGGPARSREKPRHRQIRYKEKKPLRQPEIQVSGANASDRS